MDDSHNVLRAQLADSLGWRGAHMSFDQAVKGFTRELVGTQVPGLAHTAWQIVHHIWFAQWDILEFVRNPSYESPKWPDGYWPPEGEPRPFSRWEETLGKFRSDLKAMIDLVKDPKNDLFVPIAHGQGQTVFREALLVVDHNAYHVGQLVDLRRLLDIGA